MLAPQDPPRERIKETTSALSPEQQILQTQYELTLDWVNKFYERRDRNFALYIAINGALFTAVGFLEKLLPGTLFGMFLGGLCLAIVGILGTAVAKILRDHSLTAKHLQGMANARLARLELSLLPDANFGWYCQLVAGDEFSKDFFRTYEAEALEQLKAIEPSKHLNSGDTLYERIALAKWLIIIWRSAAIIGLLLVIGVVCLTLAPWLETTFKLSTS